MVRLESWRFDDGDRIEGTASWKLSTHPARVFGANPDRPVVCNGVVATFRGLAPPSQIEVTTAQGKFTFHPDDLPYGKSARFLDGRALVDRVPASRPVVQSKDESDYPAAAVDRDGNIWVAYLNFAVNPKFTGLRWAAPASSSAVPCCR